jgi:DNA-binding response OmpR family regulator
MDILIVDDERDLCNILTLFCVRKNFTVSCAFTLKDGLTQVRSLPRLIFLDNNLTDGAGLETIKLFKTRSPHSKIAFITASIDQKIRADAFQRGADHFLAKPFHLQLVREILSGMQEMALAI